MSEQIKTHWRKMNNPDYIGAYSIMQGDKSVDLVVTIKSVANKIVVGADGKKDECIVAELVGQKPFIINATNAKMISKIYSPYIDDWIGKKITLYVAKVKVAGDTVDALRIRPTVPTGVVKQLPELTPEHDKWLGARTAILAGNTTIEKIRKVYTLSAENEALLTAPDAPTIDIEDLRELLDLKRDSISMADLKEANEIINGNQTEKFASLQTKLQAA